MGAAHNICPYQGHGHLWVLISRGLSWMLNRGVHSLLLETPSLLGLQDTTFQLTGPSPFLIGSLPWAFSLQLFSPQESSSKHWL